ncbi:MAG: TerC family protein [Planctomycetota bacterium]
MIWFWIGFILFILILLALDLGVFNKEAHIISIREAFVWTFVWICISMLFNVFIYYAYEHHWLGIGKNISEPMSGIEAATKYFTGYLVEKSLSLDNIFVIALIFGYFKIPQRFQHRVLFWGILGALVMRGIMIIAGTALIHKFEWMIVVFGVLLILTALKMLFSKEGDFDPNKNFLLKASRKLYPVSDELHENKFFVHLNGKKTATPLFLVLIVVESSDLLFALDSIPAIFAITTDSFLVFTSNVFAILGLRSLYFALAAVINKFRFLKVSLVFILIFVGIKMILTHQEYHVSTMASLSVIIGFLSFGIIGSLLFPLKGETHSKVLYEGDISATTPTKEN